MCGCGGSTGIVVSGDGTTAPRRVEGGPGEPGYTWNGPAVPAPPREVAPVPAAAAAPSE